ncbi:MAG TPA: N(4)-(beta-N-acetylglucosaminyl)-L-asparaginase [Vicinamibacterales bacterium]|nr:N(4)-(beta-N-acetylglucosaminyl)-L-asparaginase [Vicinamibacterales bacterium]HPK72246.1 N(4)-(beta-N-acetylglucosaminyl)-L-asparaginase [Vicinamibacterales bacterium]HPW20621.1 N(4)-(beta-N-acetylglucosaminyl)-L-asparaginase [Vicinamibacterales bacterium]
MMPKRLSRREFVLSSAAVATAAAARAAGADRPAPSQAPAVMIRKTVNPVVISSNNGNIYKNGGDVTGVAKAFGLIAGGSDVLDALIAGVNLCELDPLDVSVGFGGLPNADGVVQLDSSCMHGPKKRAGGVACLEGVRTASRVARAVMDETDHHLIVGQGAQDFARRLGFPIEADLTTERSRRLWLEWKRRTDGEHYLDPVRRSEAFYRTGLEMVRDGLIEFDHFWGTINCNGIGPKGEICGVTTTSGLAWKIPGRVGDSPILGAGLYVDNDVGAAGSTGRGEANLYNLCSFLIVENMRRGMGPKDAGMEALRRIRANTVEQRLLDSKGEPRFQIQFYVLNAKGEYAAVSMYPSKFAVCTEQGPQSLDCDAMFPGRPEPA